jgi:hypothetical protein
VVCGGFEGLQWWGWLDLKAFGVVFVPMMGVGPPFERRWVLGPCMVVGMWFWAVIVLPGRFVGLGSGCAEGLVFGVAVVLVSCCSGRFAKGEGDGGVSFGQAVGNC